MMTREQQKALQGLHSAFAQMTSTSLSAIHPGEIDVDVLFADQTLFSEFIEMVSDVPCSYRFTIKPWGEEAIIDFPPSIAYALIGQRLEDTGSTPSTKPQTLTSAERTAMQNMVIGILSDLEKTWEPLCALSVSDASLIEEKTRYTEVANPSELVVIVGLTVCVGSISGQMTLIYPYASLDVIPSGAN